MVLHWLFCSSVASVDKLNYLFKVNTATLLAHLRGKGVTEAKAKSKKEELVQMVVKLYL